MMGLSTIDPFPACWPMFSSEIGLSAFPTQLLRLQDLQPSITRTPAEQTAQLLPAFDLFVGGSLRTYRCPEQEQLQYTYHQQLHNFSFIRAIWHCIFYVGKFFPFNSNVIFVSLNTRARQHSLNGLSIQRDKQLRQRTGNVLGPEPDGIQAKNKTNAVEKKALATS